MKKAIHTPIFIGDIRGFALRFFKSPGPVPELPWHAMDDLFAICGFDREQRQSFLRSAQKTCGQDIKTIATASGPTTIGPHDAARGLLDAANDRGLLPGVNEEYTRAAMQALKVLTGDLPLAAGLNFVMVLARNSGIGLNSAVPTTGSESLQPHVVVWRKLVTQTRIEGAEGVTTFDHEPPLPTYFVDYIDEQGGILGVWQGPTHSRAIEAAREWGVGIVDRTGMEIRP